ncbi:MAG: hypothetical protein FJX62_06795 [Alphaproteobacteria bacterium]|nr:hypothetical protein [Alphaproteobacteria bacterium]
MSRIALSAVLALAAALFAGAPQAWSQTQPGAAGARTAPAASTPEPLVQSRDERSAARAQARPRPQIRVRPRYPYRRWHSLYPLPYSHEFPGPRAKRECVAHYATEHRWSGPVVVPRMRCRWVRG